AGPRDGQHHRAGRQQPRQHNLALRGAVFAGDAVQGGVCLDIAGGQRMPGNEPDAVRPAVAQRVFAVAVAEVVTVLHARDLKATRRRLDLLDVSFARAEQVDEPLVLRLSHPSGLLVRRHGRVYAVQLPPVDTFDA